MALHAIECGSSSCLQSARTIKKDPIKLVLAANLFSILCPFFSTHGLISSLGAWVSVLYLSV